MSKVTGKDLERLIESMFSGNNIVVKEDVPPVASSTESKSMELKLPKFALSDKWGNPDSEDREIIRLFTAQIEGNTIGEKITNINKFVADCDEACVEGKQVSQILSNLIILDSLSSLISDYNPLTGGFLMESFLSGLLGGKSKQVRASKGKIEDIYNYNNKALSIKFLVPGTPISGSKRLINNYILEAKEPITYLLIQKQREKGEKVTIGLKFYTFTIGSDEIPGDFNVNQMPLDQDAVIPKATEIATLDFGTKQQLKNIADKYVARLGDRVLVIFDELDQLTNNINKYLIGNEKSAGTAASSNAEALKVKINQEI